MNKSDRGEPLLPDQAAIQVPVVSAVAVVATVILHLLVERQGSRLLRDRARSRALANPEDLPA
jgi:hypothetical protein